MRIAQECPALRVSGLWKRYRPTWLLDIRPVSGDSYSIHIESPLIDKPRAWAKNWDRGDSRAPKNIPQRGKNPKFPQMKKCMEHLPGLKLSLKDPKNKNDSYTNHLL